MHVKYEISIMNAWKIIAKVKVDKKQAHRQEQKEYATDRSIRGNKNIWSS